MAEVSLGITCQLCPAFPTTFFNSVDDMESHAWTHGSSELSVQQSYEACFPNEPIPMSFYFDNDKSDSDMSPNAEREHSSSAKSPDFSNGISAEADDRKPDVTTLPGEVTQDGSENEILEQLMGQTCQNSDSNCSGSMQLQTHTKEQLAVGVKQVPLTSGPVSKLPVSCREHIRLYFEQKKSDGTLVDCRFPRCGLKQTVDSSRVVLHLFSHWPKTDPLFSCQRCSFQTNSPDTTHFRSSKMAHPGRKPLFTDRCGENEKGLLKLVRKCYPLLEISCSAEKNLHKDGPGQKVASESVMPGTKPCIVLLDRLDIATVAAAETSKSSECPVQLSYAELKLLEKLNKQRHPKNLPCRLCSQKFPWHVYRADALKEHTFLHCQPSQDITSTELLKVLENCFCYQQYQEPIVADEEEVSSAESNESLENYSIKDESDYDEGTKCDFGLKCGKEDAADSASLLSAAVQDCLIKMREKNLGIVSCKICKVQLAATCTTLKRHSYIHANFQLFQCMICGKGFQRKMDIKKHCQRKHASKSHLVCINDQNSQLDEELAENFRSCFDPDSAMDKSKLEQMQRQLFWKKGKKYTPSFSVKEYWEKPMGKPLQFWKELQFIIAKYRRFNSRVVCNICQSNVTMTKTSLEGHVLRHLPHAVYGCTVCAYKGNYIKGHFKQVHKGVELQFLDCSANFEEELLQLLSECFSVSTLKTRPCTSAAAFTPPETKFSIAIEHLERSVQSVDGLSCNLCGKSRKSKSLANHVLWHFGKCVYFCNYCPYQGSLIAQHLQRNHKYEKPSYKDYCHLYDSELMELLNKCFKPKDNKKSNQVELDIMRQQISQLIAKSGDAHCGKCADDRKYNSKDRVEQHAIWHLGKSRYSCNHCNYSGCYIKTHLQKDHKHSQGLQDYTDNRLEFFDDFVSSLKSCFLAKTLEAEVKEEVFDEEFVAHEQLCSPKYELVDEETRTTEHSEDLLPLVESDARGESFSRASKNCHAKDAERQKKPKLCMKKTTQGKTLESTTINGRNVPRQFLEAVRCLAASFSSEYVSCNICSAKIKVAPNSFESHSSKHLPGDLNLYSCKLCHSAHSNKDKMRRHLQRDHELIFSTQGNFSADFRHRHQEILLKYLKKCFDEAAVPDSDAVNPCDTSYTQAQALKPILFLAYLSQFRAHCASKNMGCVTCCKCKRILKVERKSLEGHIYYHENSDSYRCKDCGFKASSKSKMANHLKGAHGFPKFSMALVEDIRFLNDEKLVSMGKLCFDGAEKAEQAKKPSLFLSEMTKVMTELSKQGRNRKSVVCNLCQKSVNVFRTGLTAHVYYHTNKCLFKCNICDFEIFAKPGVDHMKVFHPGASKDLLEDMRFLVDSELAEKTQECFDGLSETPRTPRTAKKSKLNSKIFRHKKSQKTPTIFLAMISELIQLMKTNSLQSVPCKLCSDPVISNQFRTHVYKHFKGALFSCSNCGKTDLNSLACGWHIQKTEECRQIAHVVDISCQHEKDLIKLAHECFGIELGLKIEKMEEILSRVHSESSKRKKPAPRCPVQRKKRKRVVVAESDSSSSDDEKLGDIMAPGTSATKSETPATNSEFLFSLSDGAAMVVVGHELQTEVSVAESTPTETFGMNDWEEPNLMDTLVDAVGLMEASVNCVKQEVNGDGE